MAVERIDLGGSLGLEPAPVSSAPAVRAQVSPQEEEKKEEGKPQRHSPPDEALAEATQNQNNENEDGEGKDNDSGEERAPHRLDDLA